MDVEVLEGGEFVYLYKMKKGISEIEGGVNILKEMDYPDEIINSIMNEKENGDEKEKEIDN
jgi:DNA mismatch repair ATPase MutS